MTPEESQLISYANLFVDISKKLESNPAPDREGGILMRVLNNFSESKIYPIGYTSENKKLKYCNFVEEKAHRLYADWLINPDTTFSSWQTRDFDKRKYGGAVLLHKNSSSWNIISFSGLAELTDEAVSLMIGKYLGYGSEDEIKKIADSSENQVFYEMLDEIESMKI